MILTDKQIRKFQTLYKKRFNRPISRKEAMESGIKLIRLLELIIQKPSRNCTRKLSMENFPEFRDNKAGQQSYD